MKPCWRSSLKSGANALAGKGTSTPIRLTRSRCCALAASGHAAAAKRDELAALQLIEWHSVPFQPGRIAGYRVGEERSAVSDRAGSSAAPAHRGGLTGGSFARR